MPKTLVVINTDEIRHCRTCPMNQDNHCCAAGGREIDLPSCFSVRPSWCPAIIEPPRLIPEKPILDKERPISDGVFYCPHCGEQVSLFFGEYQCPKCGQVINWSYYNKITDYTATDDNIVPTGGLGDDVKFGALQD